MATKFLEPGGDATFNATAVNGFWRAIAAAPAVATDFVHGGHIKSIKYRPSNQDTVKSPLAVLADAGGRISFYFYMVTLPNALAQIMLIKNITPNTIAGVAITSAGVLQLVNDVPTQIGSNGPTLATGTWYRISLAFTVSSTTVNRFEAFVNGVSAVSVTNTTLNFTGSDNFWIGNLPLNTALDCRSSDHYVDDSSALTDTGDIWVTAKRPFANGTANNFTTQIGAGGSGYGSGHAPQVNERVVSTTNGWSILGAGSSITEEYTIEGKSVGDIDITSATIVDYSGWVLASSTLSEAVSLVVGGSSKSITTTSTVTIFQAAAGSSTYPAGNTDIGIITNTAATTFNLYECGVMVAYTPSAAVANSGFLNLM